MALLGEIDRTYSEATGYGHFENYDLFAGIAYNVIRNSANMKIQEHIAYWKDVPVIGIMPVIISKKLIYIIQTYCLRNREKYKERL